MMSANAAGVCVRKITKVQAKEMQEGNQGRQTLEPKKCENDCPNTRPMLIENTKNEIVVTGHEKPNRLPRIKTHEIEER